MSHLLSTMNPEAAARMQADIPIPRVGDTVLYHLRPGEMRAGKSFVPALVLKSDADNRRLTLLAFYDHLDFMTLDGVPERVGTDQGWEIRDTGGDGDALAKLEAFKGELAQCLFGDHERSKFSFARQIADLTERIDALEIRATATATAKTGKRARG